MFKAYRVSPSIFVLIRTESAMSFITCNTASHPQVVFFIPMYHIPEVKRVMSLLHRHVQYIMCVTCFGWVHGTISYTSPSADNCNDYESHCKVRGTLQALSVFIMRKKRHCCCTQFTFSASQRRLWLQVLLLSREPSLLQPQTQYLII